MSSAGPIAVFGAAGFVGRRICRELAAIGAPFTAVVHRSLAPGDTFGATTFIADAFDAPSLQRAFAGATVVINAAGPLRETASPILVASMAAGAHYVDVGGEQAVLHALYERHESTVRRAGLVALPGAGLDCVIGDLAAASTAEHLCGISDDGEAIREAPRDRLGEDRPFDNIDISYIYDDLALSAGSQRALFGTVGTRPLLWRRDRWEPASTGAHRAVNAGALGGERDAVIYAGGDAITIPRHVNAALVATYLSTTRRAATAAALRLLARALPLVPRAAADLLAPYADRDADPSRTSFAVIAQVRRGFSAAQIVIRGRDPYRATAAIAAWCAHALAARGAGPVGMRAPGELFRSNALRAIAARADLAIEPSFGA